MVKRSRVYSTSGQEGEVAGHSSEVGKNTGVLFTVCLLSPGN